MIRWTGSMRFQNTNLCISLNISQISRCCMNHEHMKYTTILNETLSVKILLSPKFILDSFANQSVVIQIWNRVGKGKLLAFNVDIVRYYIKLQSPTWKMRKNKRDLVYIPLSRNISVCCQPQYSEVRVITGKWLQINYQPELRQPSCIS